MPLSSKYGNMTSL